MIEEKLIFHDLSFFICQFVLQFLNFICLVTFLSQILSGQDFFVYSLIFTKLFTRLFDSILLASNANLERIQSFNSFYSILLRLNQTIKFYRPRYSKLNHIHCHCQKLFFPAPVIFFRFLFAIVFSH